MSACFWSLIHKGLMQLPLLCSYCGLLQVSEPRYWVSVHQVRRLGRVEYPATCPTSSARASARPHSDASIRV
ncbi:hypothetical protein V8C86DRAFT_2860100 [Haematococcus lacustris]